MSLTGPGPVSTNPFIRVAADLRAELRAPASYPRGEVMPSVRRTHRVIADPLGLLLDAYERYGPIFSLRVLTTRVVFMLGPAANHRMLVSHAADFSWRDGAFADLIPLLGDGLLTTDGDFHRLGRRIMLPAFHRDRIAAALTTMEAEIERAVAPWRPGDRLDLYGWTRRLALRVAMRALFGLDPDRADFDPAREFERALGYYGREYWLQVLRGPRTPWAALTGARRRLDRLIFAEIARRRGTGERGEDLLSLLLDSSDDDGRRLSDVQVRDHVMTLLFAGHDTTTATVAFLFHELARRPDVADAIAREPCGPPGYEQLMGGALPQLDMALDETLRLYPPAWVGPRRAVRTFEFEGFTVPAGAVVNYSSYVSHRLPDVWEDPHAFMPERFRPERKAALPKGAYVPFGGGSRQCIGMRFGQLEVKAIAARILARHRLELAPDYRLEVRQTPTLGPKHGLPVTVRAA